MLVSERNPCIEVYEKMTLVLTLFTTSVNSYPNEFMVSISSFKSSSLHDGVHFFSNNKQVDKLM